MNLADVVRDAIEATQPLVEQFSHAFEIDIGGEPLEVDVDPHRISQVVANLLSNAAKYTSPHGRIQVVADRDGAGRARIVVADNGLGIETHAQSRVFQMFEQEDATRQDGLGIGLTLVKTLMEMHDGSVSLCSEGRGKGSEFTLLLPLADTAGEAIVADSTAITAPPPRRRVMVVDDGRSAADVLVMFLDMEGMETAVAYDGEEAVARAAEFKPELIFMDLGMPRMDGFEAAKRIRAAQPDVILIALSGWGRDEDKNRAAAVGFDGHAVKPVCPDDVRTYLGLLDEPREHRRGAAKVI